MFKTVYQKCVYTHIYIAHCRLMDGLPLMERHCLSGPFTRTRKPNGGYALI